MAIAMKHAFPTGLTFVLLIFLSCLNVPHAAAWGRDVYTVSGLEAERMAGDAVSAKQQALDHVYKEALSQLFARLARSGDITRLPVPTRSRAEALMASFNVVSEQAGATRYSIKASVTFDRDRIAELFYRSGVRIYDKPGPLVLIIPVHVTAGGVALYDDAPEWNEAVSSAIRTPWLMAFKLASGSMQDRLESAEHLQALDRVSLDYLRVRHSAQGAMIAEFTDATDGSPARFRLAGDSGAGRFEQTRLIAPDIDDPLAFAAGLISQWLDDHWKQMQSHGPSAGVLINGVPMVPAETQRMTPELISAKEHQAMPQLRLAAAQSQPDRPAIEKTAPPQDARSTPKATGAVVQEPGNGVSQITFEVAGTVDQLSIGRKLARAKPVTAFELHADGTAQQVVLWYRKDRETLFRALSDNGLVVEHNLASNNWRITFR